MALYGKEAPSLPQEDPVLCLTFFRGVAHAAFWGKLPRTEETCKIVFSSGQRDIWYRDDRSRFRSS